MVAHLLLAGLLVVPATCYAGTYKAPAAQFTIIKAPRKLAEFISKLRDMTGQGPIGPALEEIFSQDAEIFVGGISISALPLRRIAKLEPARPKIPQVAVALREGEPPPGDRLEDHAVKDVWEFVAGNIDRSQVFGTQPGYPGRFCLGPIVSVDGDALKRAVERTDLQPQKFYATIRRVDVRAAPEIGAIVEVVPANVSIAVAKGGNGGFYTVATPGGKKGYAESASFIEIYSTGLCFAEQKDKTWLVDAVIQRGN